MPLEKKKKVAAGKALAEKNKKAREALKREEEREAASAGEKEEGDGSSWLPEISFSNFLTVIGIGLTIVSFYREYQNQKHPQVLSEPQSFSGEARTPESGEARCAQRNKMGMD